jgi:CRISPR-associated protein Cas1
VYDLQEPFPWISDVAVVEVFESGVLDLPDFYFTGDDYRYRFDVDAKQRFVDLIRERFNSGVAYKGRALKWDTVIDYKTNELGRFLTGKSPRLDFVEPGPSLERLDSRELRAKILTLTTSRAEQIGIGKSTLHYLRKNASSRDSFKAHARTVHRLEARDAGAY